MTRLTLACAAVLALTGCNDPAPHGLSYGGPPPDRYKSDATTTVQYVTDVNTVCKPTRRLEPGEELFGCTIGSRMVLRNPCLKGGDRDTCHELGHINGWPGDHPR